MVGVGTYRFAAGIEYRGSNYCGWQTQNNADTVQSRVEAAIAKVADEAVRVIAAGRTDTGVHGIGQVIHFDTQNWREPSAWLRGVNTHLPSDITLLWAKPVDEDFHARFAATERAYRYVILNRRTAPSWAHGLVAWHYPPLQLAPMQCAAQGLVGRHDFSAFRAAGCQSKQPVREIRQLCIAQHEPWLWLDIRADGFLHHMVRNIAGTLLRVGEGLESVEWVTRVLDSKDRARAGKTAPADGLYFTEAVYPLGFELPKPPPACRFW